MAQSLRSGAALRRGIWLGLDFDNRHTDLSVDKG
jgi:hypothetical protein